MLASFLLATILLLSPLPRPTSADLLPLANAARADAGLAPLSVCWPLERDAMLRAHAVIRRDPNGLTESDHSGFDAGIFAAGYTSGAENLGLLGPASVNDPSARAEVAGMWLASPPHRANTLGPYRCFGSAELAEPDGAVLYVESFGG